MQSAGGTLSPEQASRHAAKLVLSGPAGGVMGAAFIAKQLGIANCITYDMGGTSTEVATIIDGAPQWTTSTTIDGLPIALPMLDIQTVGAGGGSIAHLDAGGALASDPNQQALIPVRRVMAAVERSRPSLMRTFCSAESSPINSSAAR